MIFDCQLDFNVICSRNGNILLGYYPIRLPVISRDFHLINLHPMSFSLSLPFPQNLPIHRLAWSNIQELTWAILSFWHLFCNFNLPKISHLVYLLFFLILQFIYYSNLHKKSCYFPRFAFWTSMFPSFLTPCHLFILFFLFFLFLFQFWDFVHIITLSLPPHLTCSLNKHSYSFIITPWKYSLLIRMGLLSYPQCLNCLFTPE